MLNSTMQAFIASSTSTDNPVPGSNEPGDKAVIRLLNMIKDSGVNLGFWGSLTTIIVSIVAALFGLALLGGVFNTGVGSVKFSWASSIGKGARKARDNFGIAGAVFGVFLFMAVIIAILIGFGQLAARGG